MLQSKRIYGARRRPIGTPTRFARLLVILLATVGVLLGSAYPSVATETQAPPPLEGTELAHFIDGARTVGGLTDEQIALALKDPQVARAVVVEVAFSGEDGLAAADPKPQAGAAAGRCRTTSARYEGKNSVGQVLYRFQVDKYFCWNGVRVYSPQVTVVPTITQVGTLSGWNYEGINSYFDRYYKLGASAYGGHHSNRQGHFKLCPPRFICFQNTYPTINIWVHHDGTADRQVTI